MFTTYLIIGITCLTSYLAFNNRDLAARGIFNAYAVVHKQEYYRLLTCGFLHANWMHLFFNMFVLHSFAEVVTEAYGLVFGEGKAGLCFLFFYIMALLASSLPDAIKHRNNPHYYALGASGAVSAVVFASILIFPYGKIGIIFIPVGIPAPLFGLLYLFYSWYMGKREGGTIGHNAHFWGAVFGLIFTALVMPGTMVQFYTYLQGVFS